MLIIIILLLFVFPSGAYQLRVEDLHGMLWKYNLLSSKSINILNFWDKGSDVCVFHYIQLIYLQLHGLKEKEQVMKSARMFTEINTHMTREWRAGKNWGWWRWCCFIVSSCVLYCFCCSYQGKVENKSTELQLNVRILRLIMPGR